MIALLMSLVIVLGSSLLSAQEMEGSTAGEMNLPDSIGSQKPQEDSLQPSTKPREDKWALTDEDRMTEEEMDDELFGDRTDSSDSKPDEEKAESGIESLLSNREKEVDSPVEKKEPVRLAPKKTIESYLQNINSLTIDTYAPPSTDIDGVDVPTKRLPPRQMSSASPGSVSVIRFQTPDIYHQPLYFEDQNVERYGIHKCRRQPIASARQFTSDTISLPREIRIQPPRSFVYRVNPRYNIPTLIPANR